MMARHPTQYPSGPHGQQRPSTEADHHSRSQNGGSGGATNGYFSSEAALTNGHLQRPRLAQTMPSSSTVSKTNGNSKNDSSGMISRRTDGEAAAERRHDGESRSRPLSASQAESRSAVALQRRQTTHEDSDSEQRVLRPPRATLLRAKSDFGPRGDTPSDSSPERGTEDWSVRHGFDTLYSVEHQEKLMQQWYMYFVEKRHQTCGNPRPNDFNLQEWRQLNRLKTVSAALCICINLGVEPPDQLRTNPGARIEGWIDPISLPVPKALIEIGKSVQANFEALAIRTRYKQYLDPSVDETKKFSQSLRRNVKDERILFYYNGHGVPKPTPSGEIWVFNKTYTQYIPVSLYDLQTWLEAPTLYVWDCSEAGHILKNFERFADKHEEEQRIKEEEDPSTSRKLFRPYIHLAATDFNENLPTNPDLPADVFTACLTTPIEMALWFFVLQNPLKHDITPERARKLPGRLQERRTPVGELNWIFTAITDTIAWTTLPRHVFRQFFRQDLMVAALFRNFLLAQRILTKYGCHPQAYPKIPDTSKHALWDSWDYCCSMTLSQLVPLEQKEAGLLPNFEFQNSTFFTEQLTAFEIYLTRGAFNQDAPEQLPVVLQVLLSQQHRVRALILLGKFLDMGPWAVNLALSIGIFPYVLKLLQSQASELRPVMTFIWTRILAVDTSCQADLLKDNGFKYFVAILSPTEALPVPDESTSDHRAMSAFIIATLCRDHEAGRKAANQPLTDRPDITRPYNAMESCLIHLKYMPDPLLRQWAALCLGQLWDNFDEAKWRATRSVSPNEEIPILQLLALIKDDICEVRTAMLFALTTFLGLPDHNGKIVRLEEEITWSVMELANDASPMVRKELLVYLSKYINSFERQFVVAAFEHLQEEKEYLLHPPRDDGTELNLGLHYRRAGLRNHDGRMQDSAQGVSHNSIAARVWKHIIIMGVDPHPEVQQMAGMISDYIHNAMIHSVVGEHAQTLIEEISKLTARASAPVQDVLPERPSTPIVQDRTVVPPSPAPGGLLKRTASYFFSGLYDGAAVDASRPNSRVPSGTTVRAPFPNRRGPGADFPPEQTPAPTAPNLYHVAKEPMSLCYKKRDLRKPVELPLKSVFYDWAAEYYREPQMRISEMEEPGSVEYNRRLWRRKRNENIIAAHQPLKEMAGSSKWSTSCGLINNASQPTKLTMHQFDNHLAVADDKDTICIWDWKKNKCLSKFANGNPAGSKISDVVFINEDDVALLMTGASDGVIRVYKNYDSDKDIELAGAWRALTQLVPSNINAGMILDWQQCVGRLLVAGDTKVIRTWNVATEKCMTTINARSGACITSLSSDQMTGNTFVAGFGDGAVRVFDVRNSPAQMMVKRWKDDNDDQWVKNVHMQRGGQRELMTASRNGTVKLWDIRADRPLKVMRATSDVLRTAVMHEHLPVLAVGTEHHIVKMFNIETSAQLSAFEPYTGVFTKSRDMPIAATAFHPHKPMVAAASEMDTHICLYTCDKRDRVED